MIYLRVPKSLPALILAASLTVPVAALPFAASGCSGADKASGVAGAKVPSGSRSEAIEHEACDEKSNRVEELDSNNDGKTDIKRVYDKKSGREVCRIVDLNHDGKPDLYEYFDDAGQPRRREYAYDETGSVNVIEYLEGGKLVRREYDTTGQHRIDTWDFFDPAKAPNAKTGRPMPVRRERDTNGDGRVDQWWAWEGEKVTISFDKSGDGKPDPEATIVLNDPDAGAAAAPLVTPTRSGDGGAPSPSSTSAAADAGASGSATNTGSSGVSAADAGAATTGDAGKATGKGGAR